MALKIVHLCDVHSSKGEDIPAAFAHALTVDGGTYAIDLCPECDAERFLPLVAFLEAFGLLTDGAIDPREAIAEDLRRVYATQQSAPEKSEKKQQKKRAPAPAPAVAAAAPVEADGSAYSEPKQRILSLLKDAGADGMSSEELAHILGKTADAIGTHTTTLRHDGLIDWLGRRWYLREHVPHEEAERLARQREIVAARDSVPRICIIDGSTVASSSLWEAHCLQTHHVKPVELLGLTCPIDGEVFDRAQLLGMHGRREHDCVHTPQLFLKADNLGDPLGIVADIRTRFRVAS